MNVNVHIERIVVDGVDSKATRTEIQTAMTLKLSELFSNRADAASLGSPLSTRTRSAGVFAMEQDSPSNHLGHNLAEAIHRTCFGTDLGLLSDKVRTTT